MIGRMPAHVAFLRAINLGARRTFPSTAIVAAAEAAGFTDVATHINTGNVLVRSPMRSRARVETALEAAFEADRGFAVPTIAFTPAEVRRIVADADEVAGTMSSLGMHYVSLLKEAPPEDVARAAEEEWTDEERLVVRGRAAHLLLAERDTYATARLSNSSVEKRLGVATNRTLRVVRTVAQKWC